MPGSMSEADLVVDLKGSLQASAEAFKAGADADFKRHLSAAALDFVRARPRTLAGSITLTADQPDYAAPADLHAFLIGLWGNNRSDIKPWEAHWPGRLPVVSLIEVAGVRRLIFDPPPSARQIAVLGPDYPFRYLAVHTIHASDGAQTTIPPGDRGLLLLRAQAEAMQELALRNVAKPVQLRDGMNQQPRNGTPAYLFEALMQQFNLRAAA